MVKMKDKLAPMYGALLPDEFLDIEIPEEKFATCLACPNTANKNAARYHTKCCDYHPILPNYIVGAILSDERDDLNFGRNTVLEKIKNQVGVTPYGIFQSADYFNRFKASRDKKNKFTQEIANDLLCPYNKNNLCSIWDYRSELCATFHCTPSSGLYGNQFWSMMRNFLSTTEEKLVIKILSNLGYPTQKIEIKWRKVEEMDITKKDGTLNQNKYQNMWIDHVGNEIEFYKSCFKEMLSLDKAEVAKTMGIDLEIFTSKTKISADLLGKNIIPDFLTLQTSDQAWKEIEQTKTFHFKKSKVILTPVQIFLLKGFNGTTEIKELIHKGYLIKQNLIPAVSHFLKIGLLK